jgi:Flp pilus assembly protein TadG
MTVYSGLSRKGDLLRKGGLLRKVRSGNCRGQALVEFALCAVALLALILGVVEFGRVFVAYATIASAARVGSRYAAVSSSVPGASVTNSDVSTITSNVQSVVSSYLGGVSGSGVTVAFPDLSCSGSLPSSTCATGTFPGNHVQVTVSYPYNPLISYFGLQFALSSTSEGVITW